MCGNALHRKMHNRENMLCQLQLLKFGNKYDTNHVTTDRQECKILNAKVNNVMNSTEYIIKPDLPRHLGKVDNFKKRTREVTNSPCADQTQDSSTKTIPTRNETNLLSSILTPESNIDKKTSFENVENENYEKFEYENDNKCNESLTIPRKSNRKKSPVTRYGNPVTHCIYVNYVNVNVPNTFEEAIKCNEYKKCQKAMDSEIKSLEKNDTWQIVDKPKDKNIIDVK